MPQAAAQVRQGPVEGCVVEVVGHIQQQDEIHPLGLERELRRSG